MSWTTLTTAKLQPRLSAAELDALREEELNVGQTDPLTQIISDVTAEVRGYISAAGRYTLEATGIPDALVNAAVNRIRFEIGTRFPRAAILDDDRRTANTQAIELLGKVADRTFALEDDRPAAPTRGIQVTGTPTRRATRTTLDGL